MNDWRDKGKTNHLLINKVMEYPKAELTFYFALYYRQYYERYGVNIKFPIYQEFVDFGCEDIDKCGDSPLFKDWHNQTYLDICMWNLYEKHLGIGKSRIADEEWARLCNGYKKITGKQFGEFEPVIYAEWIHAATFDKCSNCGFEVNKHQWVTKRCPECGAYMKNYGG